MDSPLNPELIRALVERKVAEDLALERQTRLLQPEPKDAPSKTTTLSPKAALLLGGLADSASTYAFLKQGKLHEVNPALQYFNEHPWSVIPTAAASGLGYSALYDLIHKVSPKTADTLASMVGQTHMRFAGGNVEEMLRQNKK